MPKRSLKAQLNQIRAWVRQGRTDAWIAHQLEVPASELRDFRRRHDLTADGEDQGEIDLRDEIEAEIEAAEEAEVPEEEEEEEAEREEPERAVEGEGGEESDEGEEPERAEEPVKAEQTTGRRDAKAGEDDDEDRPGGRRRRRRRGRRGRGRGESKALQATFDHGKEEGYGLWLDPAVSDDPVYSEHWAGHRAIEVQIEPDRITIRRAEQANR